VPNTCYSHCGCTGKSKSNCGRLQVAPQLLAQLAATQICNAIGYRFLRKFEKERRDFISEPLATNVPCRSLSCSKIDQSVGDCGQRSACEQLKTFGESGRRSRSLRPRPIPRSAAQAKRGVEYVPSAPLAPPAPNTPRAPFDGTHSTQDAEIQ